MLRLSRRRGHLALLILLACCGPVLCNNSGPWWRTLFASPLGVGCHVRNITIGHRCEYISTHQDDCSGADSLVNYLRVVFCLFETRPWLASIAMVAWIFVLFILAVVTAEHFFCPALEEIAEYLGLPDHLAGATLLSLGNGANDVFTMIAALTQGQGKHGVSTALSEAYGSGLFITNVVLAAVTAFSTFQPIALEKRAFFRDLLFYLGAVILVFGIVLDRKVHIFEGVLLFAYYIVFLLVTIWSSRGEPPLEAPHPNPNVHHEIRRQHSADSSGSDRIINLEPVDEMFPSDSFSQSPPLLTPLLPCYDSLMAPLHSSTGNGNGGMSGRTYERQASKLSTLSTMSSMVVEHIDTYNRVKGWVEAPFVWLLRIVMPQVDPSTPYPRWCAVLLPFFAPFLLVLAKPSLFYGMNTYGGWLYGACMSTLSAALVASAYPKNGLSFGPFGGVFVVLAFVQSIVLLNIATGELMAASNAIGLLAGLSPQFMAATLMAWGNSIQDLVSNVAIAASGFPLVAVTACIAAPLFNLLAGCGIGLLMHVIKHGPITNIVVPNSVIVLFVGHVILLARYLIEVPLLRSWQLTRWGALLSVCCWAAVVPIFVLTSTHVIFTTPWLSVDDDVPQDR